MSICISPELGNEIKIKYLRRSTNCDLLGDLYEQFPFKLIHAIKSSKFMPMIGDDYVLDFRNISEYGMYDWRELFSGEPKVSVCLYDPNNVWLGFDYFPSSSRGVGGVFRPDIDIWEY